MWPARALAALAIALLSVVPALGALPPLGAAGCSERFAVAFSQGQRGQVLQQLLNQGYTIHTSGPDFAAVSRCGAEAPQQLPGSLESGASGSEARARPERRGLLGYAYASVREGLRRRRALGELSGLGGVRAAEPDVLRFLQRPAPAAPGGAQQQVSARQQWQQLQGAGRQQQQVAEAQGPPVSAGALSRLAHRVLRAALGASRRGATWSGAWTGGPSNPYASWELDQTSCSLQDEPLADYAGAEVLPWGIKAIEADSKIVPARTAGTGVVICIIDSGMWGGHPDLAGNKLSGCGVGTGSAGEPAANTKECPFEWDRDQVAHGTHVAGTIAALRNGAGVVGVIPGGADIFNVRIWNTSGDVSQGQGLFASDLVRAYSACEERLDTLKDKAAASGGPKPRMVVSMSFGSAGPLTVERLWFERASKRGDMLFVARWVGPGWVSGGGGGGWWGGLG
jgi:hypothetical protein